VSSQVTRPERRFGGRPSTSSHVAARGRCQAHNSPPPLLDPSAELRPVGLEGGATVDAAHVLDDGGRELAYVAMSRARHASHVYAAGGDLRDAAERLVWSWDQERREQSVSDRHHAAERIEALQAERRRLVSSIPPDVSAQLARLQVRTTSA
jgi:hypothetical protein